MIYKLKPIFTYNLWGGYKLAKLYNKKPEQIGEAWILSSIHDSHSPIDKDMTLGDLFLSNKDIVCKGYQGNFPLLIKLIDAEDDLSIQVHPDAKTEFWHILNNKPSKLYLGFNQRVTRKKVSDVLSNGDITSLLNHIDVNKGDSFLIKPGTIHAIGKGTFLIEIQRSADVTYRLYDFNRKDKYGNKRELHIKQGLDAINFKKLNIKKKANKNLLVSCPFFHVYHYLVNKKKTLNALDTSFHALTILSGSGYIKTKDKTLPLEPLDTVFIPAGEGKYVISGNLDVILTTL